ncbi:unnamed protein product [Kluyveromyces dobzhanskii CBS 2104]|uniref:WGS project CCBQ000000000 data, contig 00015 n=1 Tax=Kluyveromyces dobzhanskii CBS 2104 TaxID=1427455 RepID=A0A0A8LCW0_9SACH|nr:unnamed protein product [Kluyveromyces dobzhanskii CBS 2104]
MPFYTAEFDALSYRRISDSALQSIDAFRAGSSAELIQFYEKFKYDTSLQYDAEFDLQEDFFKIRYGSDKNQNWERVEDVKYYEADPRLIWSAFAYDLLQRNTGLNETIAFAWYDWVDSYDYNKLLSLKQNKVCCDFLFHNVFPRNQLRTIEEEIGERLFSYDRNQYDDDQFYSNAAAASDQNVLLLLKKHCYVDPNNFPADSKAGEGGNGSLTGVSMGYSNGVATLDLYDKVRPEVYQLQARSYVINTLKHPLSVTIMNSSKELFQYLVDGGSKQNIIRSGRLQRFLDSHGPETPRNSIKFDHVNRFKSLIESENAQKHKIVIEEVISEGQTSLNNSQEFVFLKEEDFEFDAFAKIKELEARSDTLTPHETSYLNSLKYSLSLHPAFVPKYFQESTHIQSFKKYGGHFDKRFFNGPLISDSAQMGLRLDSLIRNYQKFMQASGLISWLAHGTLYGWMYNGRSFSWDNDADVQMPIAHLNLLAQYFNQTVVLEDPSEGNGKFLIDVTSSITTRVNGNGLNNIDARFIDVDSGLYIDITGISVSSAPIFSLLDYYAKSTKDLNIDDIKFKNPNLVEGQTNFTLEELAKDITDNPAKYPASALRDVNTLILKWERRTRKKISVEEYLTPAQRYNIHHQTQLYNCRNSHFVNLNMINPLMKTEFHGVQALVPEKYVKALKNEYRVPEKYSYMTYKSNAFVPEFGSWLNVGELTRLMNKNQGDTQLQTIYDPIGDLSLESVYVLLENMATDGFSNMLSAIHNALPLNSYRVKELGITYDKSLSRDQKLDLLRILRTKVGSTLGASQKDPWLHNKQFRKWLELIKETPEDCHNARAFVDNKKAYEVWDAIVKISENSNPMLRVFNSEEPSVDSAMITDDILDLNSIGNSIFVPTKVLSSTPFKSDPEVVDKL